MYRSLRAFVLMTSVVAALEWTGANRTVADTVIGDWESGTREGWLDWNTNQITTTVGPPRFEFNSIGATKGTKAIQFNSVDGGYTQWLAIKLQLDAADQFSNGIADYRPDFLANTKFAFDITMVDTEQTLPDDFAYFGVFVNSNTFGFTRIGDPNNNDAPESVTPFTGYLGDKRWSPNELVGTQTSTWTYDIGFLHDGNTGNGEIVTGNYLELIFEEYSNGPTVIHIDNVRFFTPQVITANFDGNTVVDGSDLAIWKSNFGKTGQTNANGDANGNGTVEGGDFLAWQQQFGATTGAAAAAVAAPEPAAALLAMMALGAASLGRRRPGGGRVGASAPHRRSWVA